MKHINSRSFYATGSGTAAVVVTPDHGIPIARQVWYTSAAAGTLVAYPARTYTTTHAAVSASTTVVVHTDASGYIEGAVLTTNDYILVEGSNSTGWQFQTIANVAAVSSSTVSLTAGGNITCDSGDRVWIVRAADVLSMTTGTETVRAEYAFCGFANRPMYLLLTATGTDHLSAYIEYWARD